MIVLPFSDEEPVVRLMAAPRTMGGAVVEYLHDAILKGELSPGAALKESELCGRLDVSSTPIRDALNALAEQGLVKIEPNKAKRVAPIDLEEIADLLRAHLPIWRTAFRWAYINATETELSRLEWQLDSLDYAIKRGRKIDAASALIRFNGIILSACGSAEMARLLLSRQSALARYVILSANNLLTVAIADRYRSLLTALKSRNREKFTIEMEAIGNYLMFHVRADVRNDSN